MAALPGLAGCYLSHLARGQWRLLRARQPIATLLEDPATPAVLRARLSLVAAARDFGRRLGLEVDGQYTSYAEWPGDRLVTAVVATRPGEVDPAGFFFPLVGRVPYKGFFEPQLARAEARRLQERGLDTCLVPVPAYSTLGWLDDPVTGPLLRRDDAALAETILHELVHATVYVPSAADFNEGIATFVGQEAAVRFFSERDGDAAETARWQRRRVGDARAEARVLRELREDLAALYAEQAPGPERDGHRAALVEEARARLATLPLETRDPRERAARARLNDACLALAGTYERDLEGFAARLQALGGDLGLFVRAMREAAEQDDPRAALLAVSGARVSRGR